MKIKTSELTGAALDWAVAKCDGRIYGAPGTIYEFQPSRLWAQGGPIIEREKYEIHNSANGERVAHGEFQKYGIGPTSLIAAMRCHVASRRGDVVDIPEELLK